MTSRGTASFPATTTSCQCATAQHTPHPLQRAPRAPCCRAQSCPKTQTQGPCFLKSLFSSLLLFNNHSSTDAWHTGHDTGEDRIPLWGLWEMDCTSKQEQICTPAIIHHPSQWRFITSCAYKIRCKKAFFVYRSMKRLLEGIKERLRWKHTICWILKTRALHTGTNNQSDSMIQNFSFGVWHRSWKREPGVTMKGQSSFFFFAPQKSGLQGIGDKTWFQ